MKNKILFFTKFIVFLCIFVLLIITASFYLTPYWLYSNDPDDAGESARYENFYDMPQNTIDYITVGASNSYHGVDPMQVYAYSGITGFDLGSPGQPMVCSYYWIKEALKYQKPKYVFVEIGNLVREKSSNEGILKAILPMKASPLKLEMIKYACSKDNELKYTALFPLYQFHSRWKEFSKKDIERKNAEPYLTKGATLRFVSVNGIDADRVNLREERTVTLSSNGMLTAELQELPLNEDAKYWIEKIKELCEENDIECIPTKFPTKNWNDRWSEEAKIYFDSIGLDYLDMTENDDEIGINWQKDSFDNGKHLNYFGMAKTSKYMADYLMSLGKLSSHKGKSGYQIWDADLEEYSAWESKEIFELFDYKREKFDWLNSLLLNKDKYLILITVKKDVSAGWPESLTGVFEKMGLETDFSAIKQQSYIAVIDSGINKAEISNPDIMNYDFDWTDNNGSVHEIHMKSGGAAGDCEIQIDGSERSLDKTGMNIVVINKEDGEYLAAANLDSSSDDISFEKSGSPEDSAILENGTYTIADEESGVAMKLSIIRNDDGSYCLRDDGIGYYLSTLRSNKDGDRVGFETDQNLAVTKWRIYTASNGRYLIYSQYNGMVFAADSSGFCIKELDLNSDNQGVKIYGN
ncbi:MAG: DUF1574 domain-containing protein [Lachnospiraceae bacterium]|nr:DUF1574 domain-containing protein [Lachnospiraceae bacterium]